MIVLAKLQILRVLNIYKFFYLIKHGSALPGVKRAKFGNEDWENNVVKGIGQKLGCTRRSGFGEEKVDDKSNAGCKKRVWL